MGVKPALFQSGGQASQHYIPGAYSRIDFQSSGAGTVAANNAVLMGDSRGGKPNTVLWFSSPAEAADVLRDGALVDAIKHAFSCGGGYVPQKIAAWRVNPGTQASRDHKSSATTMITVKAWDWGLHTNQVKSKLETGTESDTKKYTIQFQNQDAIVVDNIEKKSFTIQYTGAGTAVTMDITKTGLTTTVDAGGDLDIEFASFPTIEDVVNYINDQADYTCALAEADPKDPSTELDSVTGQDIKTSAYTAKSDLQAVIDVIKTLPWIGEAAYNTGAASRAVPDNDTDWVYFSGAIDGAYTSTEWDASLALLEAENIQFIGASVEEESIHLLIKNHCEKMNSVTGKSERQFILGGTTGETVAEAITRAKNLKSSAGALCYPGFVHYDFDDMETTKTYSPAYYACKEIGRQVALALNEPATRKDVDVLQWEKTLKSTELDQLIAGGVWAGQMLKNGRKVNCRAITTYQGSRLQEVEFSMMREALFASRDLREALERTFIGRPGTNAILGDVDAIVMRKLAYYATELQIFVGNPPYSNYQKSVIGDQIKVEYDANLTAPINFIFITNHFSIYADINE